MSTLQQLQAGLGRAWDHLAEGWQQLRQRAANALTRFHPVRSADSLETASERALDQAARWGLLAAEVRDDGQDVVVKLEVPGMEPDDFEIFVHDDVLVVRGEKRIERSQQRGTYHVMECAYGAFERAVPLPAAVDDSKAQARYRRGVLQLRLPKRASASRRRIDVKTG
jgi:HSP20 family protein